MVARQLPKLKTRVRFPSPAPKIQPTLVVGFIFGDAASEENPTELPTATRGFGTKRSVVKGAHGVKTNMGIYIPFARIIRRPDAAARLFFRLCVVFTSQKRGFVIFVLGGLSLDFQYCCVRE